SPLESFLPRMTALTSGEEQAGGPFSTFVPMKSSCGMPSAIGKNAESSSSTWEELENTNANMVVMTCRCLGYESRDIQSCQCCSRRVRLHSRCAVRVCQQLHRDLLSRDVGARRYRL